MAFCFCHGHADDVWRGGGEIFIFRFRILRVYAEVREHLFHDGGEDRARLRAAGSAADLRLVVEDEQGVLRVIRRGIAAVGNDVLHAAVVALCQILIIQCDFFGCTGLARHAVTGDIAVFAAFACGVSLEDGRHALGDILGDDLTLVACISRFDNVAVTVQHAVHDVRLHNITAVCHGCNGRDHLNRRDGEVLAERRRCKLRSIELIFGEIQAVCFAGQVDARTLRKAEGFKKIEERVASHFLTQPDHVRVAGIADAVHQRFRAVTGVVPTADGVDGGIIKHPLAGAGVRGVFGGHTGFHCHGARDHFENGTGVVGITDSFVSPLLILRFGPHLVGEFVAQRGDVDALVIRKGFFRFRARLIGLGVIDGEL